MLLDARRFRSSIQTDWESIDGLAWAGLVYSALLAYALTNLMWFVAVARVGAARASVYANLQPFLGAVFALVLLSEEMGALQWAGGIAIAAGIVLGRAPRGPAGGAGARAHVAPARVGAGVDVWGGLVFAWTGP